MPTKPRSDSIFNLSVVQGGPPCTHLRQLRPRPSLGLQRHGPSVRKPTSSCLSRAAAGRGPTVGWPPGSGRRQSPPAMWPLTAGRGPGPAPGLGLWPRLGGCRMRTVSALADGWPEWGTPRPPAGSGALARPDKLSTCDLSARGPVGLILSTATGAEPRRPALIGRSTPSCQILGASSPGLPTRVLSANGRSPLD